MKLWIIILLLTVYACETDTDCGEFEICQSENCEEKSAYPLSALEIIGLCLVFISSGLSNSAGIGGGILYVILLILFFAYQANNAAALSQFTILLGSFAAFLIKIFERHPTMNKPVIEYDLVLIIISPLLVGSSIGVIINISLPFWVVLLILIILLGYLSIITIKSGVIKYKQESTAKVQPEAVEMNTESNESEDLKKIYKTEAKVLPISNIVGILIVFGIVVCISFIRGSRKFKSFAGLEYCSGLYWGISFVFLVALLLVFVLCSMYIIRRYKNKELKEYKFDACDIKWTTKRSIIIGVSGLVAGLLGAIIGVGGGIIMNPILLRFNVRPEVMAATSNFMIVLNSGIATLQYGIAGKIFFPHALLTGGFSLVGSFVGVILIKKLIIKYKRSSMIILILGIIMLVSSISILISGIYNISTQENDYGAHNYCE